MWCFSVGTEPGSEPVLMRKVKVPATSVNLSFHPGTRNLLLIATKIGIHFWDWTTGQYVWTCDPWVGRVVDAGWGGDGRVVVVGEGKAVVVRAGRGVEGSIEGFREGGLIRWVLVAAG